LEAVYVNIATKLVAEDLMFTNQQLAGDPFQWHWTVPHALNMTKLIFSIQNDLLCVM